MTKQQLITRGEGSSDCGLGAMAPSAVWQLFEDPSGESDRSMFFGRVVSAPIAERTACVTSQKTEQKLVEMDGVLQTVQRLMTAC